MKKNKSSDKAFKEIARELFKFTGTTTQIANMLDYKMSIHEVGCRLKQLRKTHPDRVSSTVENGIYIWTIKPL